MAEFQAPGEFSIAQDPNFHGREGQASEQFATAAEAKAYTQAVARGDESKFLARSWTRFDVKRNRTPDGRFAPGFSATTTFRRPAKGEDPSPPLDPIDPVTGYPRDSFPPDQ